MLLFALGEHSNHNKQTYVRVYQPIPPGVNDSTVWYTDTNLRLKCSPYITQSLHPWEYSNENILCIHTLTTHTHTHTHTLSLTHTHTHTLSLTHTHTLSLCHTHTHSLSHTHTHTHTHTLSHTNAHPHTLTPSHI